MNKTQKEKFHELLTSFETAVLTTHGGEAHFRSRPMAIADVDKNCDLWFVTNRDSAKVHEIEEDTRAQVVCQKGWTSCVCIAGKASILEDRLKIQAMWKPSYKVWFPQGVNDPNLVLIHVMGEFGEYWDNTGLNRFTYLYQAVKAIVTGTTPEVRKGEQHGQIILAD